MSSRGKPPDLTRGPALGELRVFGELASLPAAMPLLLASAPRGDGHPILVLPGLGAGDRSTRALRRYLARIGYRPSPWHQGRNRGYSAALHEDLGALLSDLVSRHSRKATLLGWSLGGLHALRVADTRSDLVRQVITLGSPLGEEISPGPPRAFPVTAIYSRSDAVVPWRLSRVSAGPRTENLEVHGSHLGLGVNPQVFLVLADRLSQPEDGWRPFERSGLRSILFPNPDRA